MGAAAGRWRGDVTAAESAGLLLFRGRAFELLRGGLRLLPRGRLFEDGRDVYPAIVDTWIALANAKAPPPPQGNRLKED